MERKVITVADDLNRKGRLVHLGTSDVASYFSESMMEDIIDIAGSVVELDFRTLYLKHLTLIGSRHLERN